MIALRRIDETRDALRTGSDTKAPLQVRIPA